MEKVIAVSYPESLASSLKMADQEFINEIRTISLIKLYELGKISSGTASRILGMNRIDFLDKIGEYNVPFINFTMKMSWMRTF